MNYQAEYEALMAWAEPHHHRWLMDVNRMIQVCSCGEERRLKIDPLIGAPIKASAG